jgi:hypothetical protein
MPRSAMTAASTAAAAVTRRAARSAVTEFRDAALLPITAADTATPTAAPTWRLMLIRPLASPCSALATPCVAATVAANTPVAVP